ncbi:MAG: hypothetical protein K0S46_2511 [Moraxellaceae bacterium]|jgi:hypothetical protein|nr:hypothetical protein [Moraxellaceae bacterium]
MSLDTLKSAGVKMALNRYLEDIGEISDIDINPDSGRVSMLASLKGDIQQVKLEMDYHLDPDALVLETFHCDRPWIENALNRYAAGKSIPLKNSLVQSALKQVL